MDSPLINEEQKPATNKCNTFKIPGKYKILFWVVLCVMMALAVLRIKNKLDNKLATYRASKRNKNGCKGISMDETIFVAIPSSTKRMVDTIHFIGALFENALCPKRIRVGVCQTMATSNTNKKGKDVYIQYTNIADNPLSLEKGTSIVTSLVDQWRQGTNKVTASKARKSGGGFRSGEFMETYKKLMGVEYAENIRVFVEPVQEAKGVSNALYLVQKYLYQGERYYACCTRPKGQRCGQNWDKLIISDLRRCLLEHPNKALVTMPLDGDYKIHNANTGHIDNKDSKKTKPKFSLFSHWSEYGIPVFKSEVYCNPPIRPFRTSTFASNFCMAEAKFLTQASPWDPWLEHLDTGVCDWCVGIRLWTKGWEFFTPTFSVLELSDSTHAQYKPKPKPKYLDPLFSQEQEASYRRVWALLNMLPNKTHVEKHYDIGRVRSTTDYKTLSGIDWTERIVYPHARVGMCIANTPKHFLTEEVVAKYGSWTDFLESTDYRPDDIWKTTGFAPT